MPIDISDEPKKSEGLIRETQFNSTQLTTPKEEWINKRKEAKKHIDGVYIPDS